MEYPAARRRAAAIRGLRRRRPADQTQGAFTVLWTIAVILIILWLLGMVTAYTLSGFIHILLVIAIIAILVRIIQGKEPV